ncbi:hypothetical protein GCM10027346_41630 [Hymenobacter seoulensis]
MHPLFIQLFIVVATVLQVLLPTPVVGQLKPERGPESTTVPVAAKRQLTALRIALPMRVDGVLDEAAWREAQPAADFVQFRPHPGVPEQHRTEVRILYDDAALYIGAVMHDVAADSIPRELTARDTYGNADRFGIFLDPYADQLNGYSFVVTSSGVQADARYSPAGGEDYNWNAVWESRTSVQGSDWVAELRIPYSAIRFSTADMQAWGLNFFRLRQRENQRFYWNEVKPQVSGFVNQWGTLTGMRGIKPPLRLSLTPYVSSYVNHNPLNVEGTKRTTASFSGGADLKWGINESFTLDATLVPDFGQVQSDNQVLNLSPFEVQFNENRPFFTEGTELFSKGGLFYSRRVGATPMGFAGVGNHLHSGERVVASPAETRLLNATKISGRTRTGLGVGFFNAVSNDVYATVRHVESGAERQVLTQPFSNYNIMVLDQSLKNNSYVSLINTNVTRAGRTYDANVTGGLFRFANKANKYALDGSVMYSRRRGTVFDSETPVSDQDGYKYGLSLGKISGNWTWTLNHGVESDRYNPNDLGILLGNNNISQSAKLAYRQYKPFWKVNNFALFTAVNHSLLYNPTRYQSLGFYLGSNTTFTKSFTQVGFDLNVDPATRNFFEPRITPLGRYFVRVPANGRLTGFLNSDARRLFAYGVHAGVDRYRLDGRLPRPRRTGYSFGAYPRYRVNDHLTFRYSLDWSLSRNQIGYVNGGLSSGQVLDRRLIQALGGDTLAGRGPVDVLAGRRNVATVANVVSAAYTFTNRMAFTVRLRHYTSSVRYATFAQLGPAGQESPLIYERNRDNTYNAFNVDAVYSWWFAPGSQVSVVWKNTGTTYLQAEQAMPQYFASFSHSINSPLNNSVSVKVIYFLDYLAFKTGKGGHRPD